MRLSAPPTCRQVACCAHRGDSSRYRENTVPAVRSAVAHGAEFVEVDARVARDGTVVLLHDPSLIRRWGHPADVADLTWPQLQALGGPVWRIPRLKQVLELFVDAGSTLLIDLDSAAAARATYEVTSRSAASVAFCGDLEAMETIRRLDPAARIWLPWDSPEMPTRDELAFAPAFLNVDAHVLSQRLVDQAHALGVRVAVWTLDDEAAMRRALEWGVDSVTTNELLLLRALRESVDPAHDGVSLAVARWTARELASWAGRWTRTAPTGRIETKEHAADLVTEVDVSVEQHVRAVITEWFPGHDIVGEELGGSPRAGQPCWYLDPVDGTTNVANQLPWSAFSLALAVDGIPLVGVVADPWRGEIFEAVRGRGARLNGRPLRLGNGDQAAALPPQDPLTGRVVSTELDAHRVWPGMLELLAALGERHCTLRIMGSGTMTLVGVAAGRGVGAVIGQYGPVDHLAAALIVHEAGGVVGEDEPVPHERRHHGRHTRGRTRAVQLVAAPRGTATHLTQRLEEHRLPGSPGSVPPPLSAIPASAFHGAVGPPEGEEEPARAVADMLAFAGLQAETTPGEGQSVAGPHEGAATMARSRQGRVSIAESLPTQLFRRASLRRG